MSKIIETDCGNVTELAGDEVSAEVFLTESAQTKINEILQEENEGSFLRVAVNGGGCSGFQYFFGIMDDIEEEDIVKEWDGGKLVVDNTSMEYIKGATIDFVDSFMGEHFSVDNPLATSSCGCGSSFDMDMDYD